MMDNVCSLCGSRNDLETSGNAYLCASCRDARGAMDARLAFAKWAVEHGKISDFPGEVDAVFEQSHKAES